MNGSLINCHGNGIELIAKLIVAYEMMVKLLPCLRFWTYECGCVRLIAPTGKGVDIVR